MSKKEKKIANPVEEPIVLDIPEDEIWTYQVEGLAAPHINKPYKHYGFKKVIFTLVIIVAVSLSMYFSVRTVQKETFEYAQTEIGYQLDKFSNTGFITELDIDYAMEVIYDEDNPDVNTNFTLKKDESKPITSIRQYALNCDEKVKVINIGADVLQIDGKSFYSCWALQRIEVDENNPNYCDVDGVLYNKDKTVLICVPCDRDSYLAEKYGYKIEYDDYGGRIEPAAEDPIYPQYVNDVLTYVVPSSVKTIGELAFNYANLVNVYLPEGVTRIETFGFYEIPRLANVYSYVPVNAVEDTHFNSVEALGKVYLSLPEGLEYIGSDAFTQCQALTYMFIPSTVKEIGHHAFWDTCYKQDDNVMGVNAMNIAVDEDTFKDNVVTGDNWRPQYDFLLFKKSIDINYSATREAIK